MAESPSIKPFAGWFYDQSKIKAYQDVVCPPYDVIDAKKKQVCYRQSPYNYCRILLKEEGKTYADLAARFQKWMNAGIFVQEAKEAFYLYRQQYTFERVRHQRIGIIGLLRVDDEQLIHPHEYTHQKAKDDRSEVLKQVHANLEPIFIISPERFRELRKTFASSASKKPKLSFKDCDGVRHTLWALNTPAQIQKIMREMNNKKMVIADGHHRFEVSREFYNQAGKKLGLSDANYILAYFTDCASLEVMPTHRIMHLPGSITDSLENIGKTFTITAVKNQQTLEKRLKKSQPRYMAFGLYDGKKYHLCTQKKSVILKKHPVSYADPVFGHLDVFLLHKVIFDIILRVPENTPITYTHSVKEAVALANDQKAVAFIIRPTTVKEIIHLAKKGIRMPQKSTYFYPKVLSGMLLRRF